VGGKQKKKKRGQGTVKKFRIRRGKKRKGKGERKAAAKTIRSTESTSSFIVKGRRTKQFLGERKKGSSEAIKEAAMENG